MLLGMKDQTNFQVKNSIGKKKKTFANISKLFIQQYCKYQLTYTQNDMIPSFNI